MNTVENDLMKNFTKNGLTNDNAILAGRITNLSHARQFDARAEKQTGWRSRRHPVVEQHSSPMPAYGTSGT